MPRERKPAKKILDWEELERAPNTRGALAFLKSAAEIVSIRKSDSQLLRASDSTTVVDTTTVVIKQPAERRKPPPRPCYLAQDGHSLGEAALYQVLWTRGEPDTDGSRIITAGWKTMQRLCGMTDKNCKRNTCGLIEKLAIEVVGAENVSTRTGRTYRIHSYVSILARHKAAGLEWVSRDKSRRFVQRDGSPMPGDSHVISPDNNPTTVAELHGTDLTTVAELPRINPTTVVVTTTGTMVYKTPGTMVATTTVLGSTLGSTEEEVPSTTTDVDLVVQALADQAGVADASAANRLITECRSACPDATTSEIIGIIQEKAFAARSRRDVRNLIGFLLSTVPPVFDGQGITSYRRLLEAEAEAKRRKAEEQRQSREETLSYFRQKIERLGALLAQPGLSHDRGEELRKRIGEYERFIEPKERS